MDIHYFSSSFIILLVSFLVLLYILTTRSKSTPGNLPPGPTKLPLIGNFHLFAGSLPAHRVLYQLALKYGPLMHLQLGQVSAVVVSSPEIAKQFLKTHDITFANRPSLLVSEIVWYNNTDIAFAPYGDYWRQLRKICTLELLSHRRVQSFQSLRENEFSDLCTWIASKQGSKINLTERVELAISNSFMQASIGRNTHVQEQAILISAIKEALGFATGDSVADVYPSIKLLRPMGGTRAKLERIHKIIDKILEDMINHHKMDSGEGECKQQEDLLDVLLKFNHAGHELYLTVENVKAVILDMFIAGIGASSGTIDWAMAEMLRHPIVLQKAQAEVARVFNNKGFVDESDLDQLKFLKLVIKETLRMHPAAPLLLTRINYKTCEVNGYKIDAKTRVMVNAWAIGRDPMYWKDADKFMPERFVDISVDYKGNNFEYIPFGAGRRICPGISFALAQVELPLAMFLYHFDWVLPGNPDMTETLGAAARRKNPLYVIPVVKNPLPV